MHNVFLHAGKKENRGKKMFGQIVLRESLVSKQSVCFESGTQAWEMSNQKGCATS